jgi:NADH:ubiquinone oxidoreductase subunit E
MVKLSVDGLKKFQEKAAGELTKEGRTDLLICGGTGCHATGSIKVIDVARNEVKARGLEDTVKVVETGCNGFCALGPIMVVQPEGIFMRK